MGAGATAQPARTAADTAIAADSSSLFMAWIPGGDGAVKSNAPTAGGLTRSGGCYEALQMVACAVGGTRRSRLHRARIVGATLISTGNRATIIKPRRFGSSASPEQAMPPQRSWWLAAPPGNTGLRGHRQRVGGSLIRDDRQKAGLASDQHFQPLALNYRKQSRCGAAGFFIPVFPLLNGGGAGVEISSEYRLADVQVFPQAPDHFRCVGRRWQALCW